jgi:hypothetical protein
MLHLDGAEYAQQSVESQTNSDAIESQANFEANVSAQMQEKFGANAPMIVEETEPMVVYVPDGGSAINIYEGQEERADFDPTNPRGWMVLEQETLNLRGKTDINNPMSFLRATAVRSTRKSCLANGPIKDLQKTLALIKANRYPNARIQTIEVLEAAAGDMKASMKPEAFEKAIKRAGSSDDAPYITRGGQRIVRMSLPDYYGNQPDFLVNHDNTKELSDYAKLRREGQQAEFDALKKIEKPVAEKAEKAPKKEEAAL